MTSRAPGLYIILDGPPGPESGRFVEVEDENGQSVGMDGRAWVEEHWISQPSTWRLGPFAPNDPFYCVVCGTRLSAEGDVCAKCALVGGKA